MSIIIREPDLKNVNADGIPEDFAQIMAYFNRGISSGSGWYRFVPRRALVTVNEVRDRWVPGAKENMGLVAELDGIVVGSIVVINNPASTDYEHSGRREPGAVAEGVDPDVDFKTVFSALYTGLTERLSNEGKRARAIFPVEDVAAAEILRGFGYKEKEVEHEPYKSIGLSGTGLEFDLP